MIATFHDISGDLGKELKNLITMMDQEEAAEAEASSGNTRKKLFGTVRLRNL